MHLFSHYALSKGKTRMRKSGVLVVSEDGDTVTYSLNTLQERGQLFVGPAEKVYHGQIIGLHTRENDLVVNPCKTKKLTNVRSAGNDENIFLTPPRIFSLEEALEFIGTDELVEVTPKSVRLRKKYLEHTQRKRFDRDGV